MMSLFIRMWSVYHIIFCFHLRMRICAAVVAYKYSIPVYPTFAYRLLTHERVCSVCSQPRRELLYSSPSQLNSESEELPRLSKSWRMTQSTLLSTAATFSQAITAPSASPAPYQQSRRLALSIPLRAAFMVGALYYSHNQNWYERYDDISQILCM